MLEFRLLGLWHAVVVYFGCMLLWQSDPAFFSSGLTLDYWSFGTLIYHAVIFVVSLKVILLILFLICISLFYHHFLLVDD